ncbi:MAG: thiamine pyrophosphate-binding protein, partial [Bacteroidota bacterium]
MPKMTAAEAAVRVMESEGVDLVFGIPGAAILPLYD